MSGNCQLRCCKHGPMKTFLDRRAFLALAAATAAVAGPARASERKKRHDRDHEEARRALEEGRARPLAEILQEVRHKLGGEVIAVEFEREEGRFVYEIKLVDSEGRLREVYVDAMTAEILKDEVD